MQQQNNNVAIADDEIDLKELFRTLAKNKRFIFLFTIVVTVLSVIYVYSKKPIYEVKSVIRIGFIPPTGVLTESKLVENSSVLETKLRVIYNIDDTTKKMNFENGEVTNITAVKKADSFLEISTQAYSNEKAEIKNKEVVSYIQNEYKYKIDEYNFLVDSNLKKIEEQISLLSNTDLIAIENKLSFNKEKLVQYQENINEISKRRSPNDTQNMLSAIEILNYQNLILNLQNQIENLNTEKQAISNEKIPTLKRNYELEKLKLTNNTAKNSEIVGQMEIDENPVKPKKALTIIVAFITGLILSIFIVFIREFLQNGLNKES